MEDKKIIYYEDELNDDFAKMNIIPTTIDENYKYFHKNPLWNICSFLLQNIFSMPIKCLYSKFKFNHKIIGREKYKECKDKGYFIYANHTQPFADTFLPSLSNYPKRNFFIVNPENISMKGLKTLVKMLGAIPVPGNIKATKIFLNQIKYTIKKGYSITIYPEAHIWPYYTKIRDFKSVSFKYPVELNAPVYVHTNTYQKTKKGKCQIVTYIDGPIYTDSSLNKKESQEKLCNEVKQLMIGRSKESNYEKIIYIKKEVVTNTEVENTNF